MTGTDIWRVVEGVTWTAVAGALCTAVVTVTLGARVRRLRTRRARRGTRAALRSCPIRRRPAWWRTARRPPGLQHDVGIGGCGAAAHIELVSVPR
ncbi:hypothetical protein JCM4914_69770 [Streptomyces platensis subsp. malvinus]